MLNSKICVVTGAARGIGKAIAIEFARNGAVVYAIDMNSDALQEWVPQSEWANQIIPISLDITDSNALKGAIKKIKDESGRLDVLVNNAAIISYEPFPMVSKANMEKMFSVNVFALVELMQYAYRLMSKQQAGSIINMASMVGVQGASGQAIYSAAKGAVVSLTKATAKEFAPNQVRVNAIAPGMVATERFVGELERFPQMVDNIRLGRLASEADIANAALFLASDKSAYITGQILGVDGGIIL